MERSEKSKRSEFFRGREGGEEEKRNLGNFAFCAVELARACSGSLLTFTSTWSQRLVLHRPTAARPTRAAPELSRPICTYPASRSTSAADMVVVPPRRVAWATSEEYQMVYGCLFASDGDQAAQRYGIDRVSPSALPVDFFPRELTVCIPSDQGLDGAWELSACCRVYS